jgi:predicted ATP-grasp superfamily ATP-dependent carboligase
VNTDARGAVVLLDGFWPKTLVAARALADAGERVVVGERTRLAPALWSKACARRFVHADPIEREADFVAQLESVAREESRRGPVVLVPMEEETLVVVLRHRARLEQVAALPFADLALIERLRDKQSFGELARAHGLPTPKTRSFRDERELLGAYSELGLPLVVKLRVSSGARGVEHATTRDELLAAGRRALAVDPTPIVQEKLPREGEAIGVSLLLWRDAVAQSDAARAAASVRPRLLAGFVHRRLREYPVSGGSSTLREAVRDDALVQRCAQLLASIGFVGVAMLEWKRDVRDGELKLLECNPRFWGSLHQAVLSGVDFPTLLVRAARGEPVEPVRDYATARRSRAFFPADLLHWWNARPRPRRFFARDPAVVDELWRAGDLAPAFVKLLGFVPLLANRGIRRLATRPTSSTALPPSSLRGCATR